MKGRNKKSSRSFAENQRTIPEFLTTAPEWQLVSATSTTSTTSGKTIDQSMSPFNYTSGNSGLHTVNQVAATWSEVAGKQHGNVAVLRYQEISLQHGQTISPIDPSYPEIDPQRITEKTRQPIPLEVMQSLRESAEILYNEVAERNRQLEDSRYREIENQLSNMKTTIERLEQSHQEQFSVGTRQKLRKKQMAEIVETFASQFSKLPFLEQITISPTGEGIDALFVHSSKNTVDAIEKIVNVLVKIQDRFPHLYIEPKVIPNSEASRVATRGQEIIKFKKA